MELFFDFREQYLNAALDAFRPKLRAAGYELPTEVKVSCGFAPGSRGGKTILGVCISPKASAAGHTEMFISPTESDPVKVIGTLLHESGHACVGVEAGHGPKFKAFCAAMGLVGKATEAAPGPECERWIREELLPVLGQYPHAAVDPSQRKKQGTRMIKLVCPETGYTVRTTKKWLAHGLPVSPAGCEMVVAEDDTEE